jgi:hypothetical protein
MARQPHCNNWIWLVFVQVNLYKLAIYKWWSFIITNSNDLSLQTGGVRVDDGFLIVTNDLAQTFLREQNTTLKCHPYGDQAIAMWMNKIPGVTYFGDPRVQHGGLKRKKIRQSDDMCEKFLALHRSYPAEVELYWRRYLSHSGTRKNYTTPPITYPCGTINKTYNYRSFRGRYRAEPKLCRENPIWSIGEFYAGRSRGKSWIAHVAWCQNCPRIANYY